MVDNITNHNNINNAFKRQTVMVDNITSHNNTNNAVKPQTAMVDNITNYNKRTLCQTSNSNGRQFHQSQQYKQRPVKRQTAMVDNITNNNNINNALSNVKQ